MPELRVFADGDAVVEACAREIVALQGTAPFHLALSGGSTPEALYRRLASESLDQVHAWFGDERCVAPDHADSNYGMAMRAWPLPADRVHRMRGELEPDAAAYLYANELRSVFGDFALPRFDLVLLGVGEDGHTASLFPGTTATHETNKWVVANHVPKLDAWRITLTFPVLNAARRVWVLAVGGKKAPIVKDVLGDRDVARWPVQGVQPAVGELVWWLDEDAAALKPD